MLRLDVGRGRGPVAQGQGAHRVLADVAGPRDAAPRSRGKRARVQRWDAAAADVSDLERCLPAGVQLLRLLERTSIG